MSKLRVHELAKEIGRQNKEVMNYLKTRGLDIKSHMSMVEEPWISEVKNKFNMPMSRGVPKHWPV